MYYLQPKLSFYLCDCTLANRNICVPSVDMSTKLILACCLGPDLEKKKEIAFITLRVTEAHTVVSCVIERNTKTSYPQSVVPGSCAEGRPIRRDTQCADTVLMSKQNGDPCSFENIPHVYSVVVIATKQ